MMDYVKAAQRQIHVSKTSVAFSEAIQVSRGLFAEGNYEHEPNIHSPLLFRNFLLYTLALGLF